jgi:hypothetical protein
MTGAGSARLCGNVARIAATVRDVRNRFMPPHPWRRKSTKAFPAMQRADKPLKNAAHVLNAADWTRLARNGSVIEAPPQYVFIGGTPWHADKNHRTAAMKADTAVPTSNNVAIFIFAVLFGFPKPHAWTAAHFNTRCSIGARRSVEITGNSNLLIGS